MLTHMSPPLGLGKKCPAKIAYKVLKTWSLSSKHTQTYILSWVLFMSCKSIIYCVQQTRIYIWGKIPTELRAIKLKDVAKCQMLLYFKVKKLLLCIKISWWWSHFRSQFGLWNSVFTNCGFKCVESHLRCSATIQSKKIKRHHIYVWYSCDYTCMYKYVKYCKHLWDENM